MRSDLGTDSGSDLGTDSGSDLGTNSGSVADSDLPSFYVTEPETYRQPSADGKRRDASTDYPAAVASTDHIYGADPGTNRGAHHFVRKGNVPDR